MNRIVNALRVPAGLVSPVLLPRAIIVIALALGRCATAELRQARRQRHRPARRAALRRYVIAKNGPEFTSFESDDRNHCMRAHGYIRPCEVGK